MTSAVRIAPVDAGEIRRLTTLGEVSQALASTVDLKAALQRVLEALEAHHDAVCGAVMLLGEGSSEAYIEASIGLTTEGQRARYKLGEGITGRVIESGKPIVVPEVSKEPLFLNRAARRKPSAGRERSFISVPILLDKKAAGALGVEFPWRKDRDYDGTVKFLKVVASMIGQALRWHRRIESERQRLEDENVHLRRELKERYDFSNIIGNSGPMRQAYEQIAQVARTNTTVLIRGESGTGKELVAKAIYQHSTRSHAPLVVVNCVAVPETLLESELFGHERGAFTGAAARRIGKFEQADGGTIFLDEIGDVPLSIQSKILRVLQEKTFQRLGSNATLRSDVRVLAATNRDLEKAVAEGRFREDLYHRLNVVTVWVPPLRQRLEDIPALVDFFVARFAQEMRVARPVVSGEAIQRLEQYSWPGNVRELEHCIQRAMIFTRGYSIQPVDLRLPAEASGQGADESAPYLETLHRCIEHYLAHRSGSGTLRQFLDLAEKLLLTEALRRTRGHRTRAARLLGIPRPTLHARLQRHGLGGHPTE